MQQMLEERKNELGMQRLLEKSRTILENLQADMQKARCRQQLFSIDASMVSNVARLVLEVLIDEATRLGVRLVDLLQEQNNANSRTGEHPEGAVADNVELATERMMNCECFVGLMEKLYEDGRLPDLRAEVRADITVGIDIDAVMA